ncbi:B4GAT1 [Mytilus edulis]|uniref:Beta-1,4-glucuronyltransferase 1 n=1 Tax=Mytilus edulis TaxID=6550 RepID=A0A8S3TWV2_MYTED|nr:B4GAT1 [Mytilus edulis]
MTLPNNRKNEGQHGKVRLLISKIENAHVLDSSGSYNIITDIFCHEDSSPTLHNDVTLVSQTSSNNLDDVIALSERWDGAISISVFTHFKDLQFAMDKLLHLHLCFPKIQNRVHFHLVYPLDNDISLDELKHNFVSSNCENSMKTFHHQNYEIEGIEYPHNLLRNTAVKFCVKQAMFLIDIDMLPNKYLRREFNTFVQSFKNDSVVFVVPSFESKDDAVIPNKIDTTFKKLRDKEKSIHFIFDVCQKVSKVTDYDQWQFLPDLVI